MDQRFNEKQLGFQTRGSKVLAIAKLVDELQFIISTKQFCFFLDFSRAFEIVNHDLIIEKRKNYGLR